MDENMTCGGEEELTRLLIVEDSRAFSLLLTKVIKKKLSIDVEVFSNYSDVHNHLAACAENYFAALLDLNLPDAPNGEVVDLVLSKDIPAIVFTGTVSDDVREMMWAKKIVDYIPKESPENVYQVVSLVKRLKKNIGMNVLVVDDSALGRKLIRDLLCAWNFTVLEAKCGQEALQIISGGEDLSLIITDYNMPNMDGIALVKEIRNSFPKTDLPIIGISSQGNANTSAYFIKAGANDYMHKPFIAEELYCRVLYNIENIEYIKTIRDMAEKDFLTGIYNRRSFFKYGHKLFNRFKNSEVGLAIAMVDIDHFKRCNDTYGHDAGDEVIRFVAQTLTSNLNNSDLVARFGGEEFCIACVNFDQQNIESAMELLRQRISQSTIHFNKQEIQVTVSIGICVKEGDTLEEMITCADDMLYEAKSAGRNQIKTLHI